jgi:hypothetical protein
MSTLGLSVLEQLQQVAIGALSANPVFTGGYSVNGQPIPLITETKGDITQQITLAIDSVGVCVLVMTPAFEFIDEILYPPDLAGWALLAITVFENATINLGPTGTRLPAIRLASQVLATLHGLAHNLSVAPATPAVPPRFIGTKRPIVMTNEGPPLQYTISFTAYLFLP